MAQFITEADLRAMCLPAGFALQLPASVQLSPAARDYCAERGITIKADQMAQSHSAKPEHLTHLRGIALVPKTHPCIALRGKLDSLQALLLQGIVQAKSLRRESCAAGLQECFSLAQEIMAAEVKEQPLAELQLLGMNSAQIRHASHNPEAWAGISYPTPHAEMGALCLALNYLRTQVRETELCAVAAFGEQRVDIIEALNRMSSVVYLLFLKELAA